TQEVTSIARGIAQKWRAFERAVWQHPATEGVQALLAQMSGKAGGAPLNGGGGGDTSGTVGFNVNFDFDMSGGLEDYKKQQAAKKAEAEAEAQPPVTNKTGIRLGTSSTERGTKQ